MRPQRRGLPHKWRRLPLGGPPSDAMTSAQETGSTETRIIGQGAFTPTHWSVVLATREEGAPEARDALERLCRTYWFPLYAYVRRRGYSHEEAEDLTQAGCLTQSRADIPYGQLAAALGVGEAAVRMAVHRLRQRYRDLLRAEIARGLADPAEIEEELRYLHRVLAG